MDILTHTISGLVIGTVAAGFSKETGLKKSGIVMAGGIGGCLPDIDAISLWSGFDATIGKIFGLSVSGHDIYFGTYWYSHHGFFHSLAAIAIYVLLFWIIQRLTKNKVAKKPPFNVVTAFAGGYLIHIFEDMPTPAGSWGGVNMFWPSSDWIGGPGQIWWWNNYDIFLIAFTALCLNLIILSLSTNHKKTGLLTSCCFTFALASGFYQINSRGFDFNIQGFQSKEIKSLEIQRKILGDTLYGFMLILDEKVKVNF